MGCTVPLFPLSAKADSPHNGGFYGNKYESTHIEWEIQRH
jgi:hypothetical protein